MHIIYVFIGVFMTAGIYRIKCIENNKIYIGSSYQIEKRLKEHIRDLKAKRHANNYLQNAFNLYGLENFTFDIIEECSSDQLLIREQYYLDQVFESGNTFNLALVAGSPTKNRKMPPKSEETKDKISKSNKGKIRTTEAKINLSNAHKGHKPSKETIERMKLAQQNRKPISDETRQKMRDAAKGRVISDNQKELMSKAHKGRKATEETKKKLSDIRKGRVMSEDTKRKISESRRKNK